MNRSKQPIVMLGVIIGFIAGAMILPGMIGAGSLDPPGPPGSTMHTLDEIYQKVNLQGYPHAPVEKTGQSTQYRDHDDGDLEKGVAWPNPRFTDNSDGTVTDNLTGLIWLKDANCDGSKNWEGAVDYAAGLFDGCTNCGGTNNDCNLSDGSKAGDWRLPNVRELHSLIHYGVISPAVPNTAGTGKWSPGDPFTNVQSSYYWSGSTYAGGPDSAWNVYMSYGYVGSHDETYYNYVWPVRGGN